MDVALDGGEHHFGAAFGGGLLHELLEMIDRGLHRFGRLQYFGDDQLVVIEKPSNFGHARHQRAVDDVERGHAFRQFLIEVGDEAVLRAFENVICEALIEREIFGTRFLAGAGGAEMFGDRRNMELIDGGFLLARLLAPVGRGAANYCGLRMRVRDVSRDTVEEQIFGQRALVLGDRREALDAFGVDDGEIEAGLRAVVEKDGVDDFARAGRKAEGNIGNSKNCADVRNLLLDQANAFDRFDGAADIVFIARCAREDERIENYIFSADAVFPGEQLVGTLGDFEFPLARERLGLHLGSSSMHPTTIAAP